MDLTDSLRIETPEQIDLDLELAGLGTRFLARLIDWAIKLLITALVFVFGLWVGIGFAAVGAEGIFPYILAAFGVAFLFFLWFGYDIYYEVRANGRTPGKRAVGARVIRDGGAPVDFTAACVRNLLAVADFLPMLYFFGALMIMLTAKKQRLGDMAAGTLVVRDRTDAAPADLVESFERFAVAEITFTSVQLAKCQANDRMILHSFFQRYDSMDGKARQALAHRLAAGLRERMEYAPPTDPPAVDFLASLLRDLNRKARQGY